MLQRAGRTLAMRVVVPIAPMSAPPWRSGSPSPSASSPAGWSDPAVLVRRADILRKAGTRMDRLGTVEIHLSPRRAERQAAEWAWLLAAGMLAGQMGAMRSEVAGFIQSLRQSDAA